MQRKTFIRGALALAAVPLVGTRAMAQAKGGTIRFIVPYPPGGAGDQVTRLVAHEASSVLGQPIVIENRGGAAGMIAAQAVLQAEPDGATFYVGANAPLVINQAIYSKMAYDPAKDFVPVAGMGRASLLLVARNSLGVHNLEELVEAAKKAPNPLSMGSASSGNITHLAGEYAASQLGFKVSHIPFPGSAPAITAMLGDHIDIMFDALPSCIQHARAGRITPIAILDKQRFPLLPDVPSMQELGHPELDAAAWFGVAARTGTPQPAIDGLNQAINAALKKPELVEKLRNIGALPMPGSPEQFAQFIAAERRQWMPLAQSLGVKAD
ncbi:tripartite tricarboxylate transporter substrate binding protein [Corticibacter populi]|uniref:Tripartite tricarboxylate transporter substrate binding protein n=1 Tax=Corticibacter populi TaxID=1550736 RepID=A0A3M6QUC6_9BURK|nr:tripartite tricarboxylate transporter substrate binding protein [Corticibacter populi]RMX06634.1 tripartite tricarboxylate transporter substrate binding protein [Corticibacter populi]RZS31794.1 tripartite-type tricarboxylate transporter receptor subunit TctC [Corticibacter populi]